MTYCDIFWVFQFFSLEKGEPDIFIKIITDIWDSFISFVSVNQNWVSRQTIFITQTLYQIEIF